MFKLHKSVLSILHVSSPANKVGQRDVNCIENVPNKRQIKDEQSCF